MVWKRERVIERERERERWFREMWSERQRAGETERRRCRGRRREQGIKNIGAYE